MEFMGWRTTEVDDYGSSVSSTAEKTLVHRDWNLLMSVVEKIRDVMDMKPLSNTIDFLIARTNPPAWKQWDSITDLWQAVVSFIKFYNQQNNS